MKQMEAIMSPNVRIPRRSCSFCSLMLQTTVEHVLVCASAPRWQYYLTSHPGFNVMTGERNRQTRHENMTRGALFCFSTMDTENFRLCANASKPFKIPMHQGCRKPQSQRSGQRRLWSWCTPEFWKNWPTQFSCKLGTIIDDVRPCGCFQVDQRTK